MWTRLQFPEQLFRWYLKHFLRPSGVLNWPFPPLAVALFLPRPLLFLPEPPFEAPELLPLPPEFAAASRAPRPRLREVFPCWFVAMVTADGEPSGRRHGQPFLDALVPQDLAHAMRQSVDDPVIHSEHGCTVAECHAKGLDIVHVGRDIAIRRQEHNPEVMDVVLWLNRAPEEFLDRVLLDGVAQPLRVDEPLLPAEDGGDLVLDDLRRTLGHGLHVDVPDDGVLVIDRGHVPPAPLILSQAGRPPAALSNAGGDPVAGGSGCPSRC